MNDCEKCPYKKLCEEIEIEDLSCDEVRKIATHPANAEIGYIIVEDE